MSGLKKESQNHVANSLGRGGRLDVPVSHARIVHVRIVYVGEPLDGGILAQEPGARAKVLPRQAGVPLVIVLHIKNRGQLYVASLNFVPLILLKKKLLS
jgi:hypothetical protein